VGVSDASPPAAGVPPWRTVGRVLARHRVAPLSAIDPITRAPVRRRHTSSPTPAPGCPTTTGSSRWTAGGSATTLDEPTPPSAAGPRSPAPQRDRQQRPGSVQLAHPRADARTSPTRSGGCSNPCSRRPSDAAGRCWTYRRLINGIRWRTGPVHPGVTYPDATAPGSRSTGCSAAGDARRYLDRSWVRPTSTPPALATTTDNVNHAVTNQPITVRGDPGPPGSTWPADRAAGPCRSSSPRGVPGGSTGPGRLGTARSSPGCSTGSG